MQSVAVHSRDFNAIVAQRANYGIHFMVSESIRVLTKSDVERLLDMRSCIDAVENAFRLKGAGGPTPGGILGVHVPGGGFHAKAAFLELSRPYFVAKINANFPGNPLKR